MKGVEAVRSILKSDVGASNPAIVAAKELFSPKFSGTRFSRRTVLAAGVAGVGLGLSTVARPDFSRASDELVYTEQEGNPTQASRFDWGPGLVRDPQSGEVEIDPDRVFFGTSRNLAGKDLPEAYFCSQLKLKGGNEYWIQGGEPIPQELAVTMFPGELIKVSTQDGANLIDSQHPIKVGQTDIDKVYEIHTACRGALLGEGSSAETDEYEGTAFSPENVLEQCMSDAGQCADYRINLLGLKGPASNSADAVAAQVLPFGDQCVTWRIDPNSGWYGVFYNIDKPTDSGEKGGYDVVKPGEEFSPKNYDGSCAAFFLMRPRMIESGPSTTKPSHE